MRSLESDDDFVNFLYKYFLDLLIIRKINKVIIKDAW